MLRQTRRRSHAEQAPQRYTIGVKAGFEGVMARRDFGDVVTPELKAFLFLMDYHARRRVKFWGRAEVLDDDALRQHLDTPDYSAIIERVIVFHVAAWDANCPQHIRPR